MKATTVVYSAILLTGTRGFSPNTLIQLSNTRTTVAKSNTSRQHTTHDLRLHAWSPFQKDTPPIPDEAPALASLEPGSLDTKNAAAFAVWISLIIYAFLFAPGSLGAQADTDMVNTLISQPYPRPESVNPIWFTVWNTFVPVPAFLAALSAPTGRGQRLPAAPFLFGSVFLGYFALGPYFSTRTVRTDPVTKGDLGWASQNIFENRLFGVALTALSLSIPVTAGLFAPEFDLSTSVAGFADLVSESRFVAVASLDITIMSLLAAVLVGEDSKRRGWEDKSTLLTAGSILLPVVGPSLYLATRPSLDE